METLVMVALIMVVIAVIFSLGYLAGASYASKNVREMEEANKAMQESLNKLNALMIETREDLGEMLNKGDFR